MATYRVINGKRYDQRSDQIIACYGSGGSPHNLFYWEERLYRKKNGEYYLVRDTGPSDKYKSIDLNRPSLTARIILLSEEEANSWLRHHHHPLSIINTIQEGI